MSDSVLGGKIQNGEGMKYTATVVDGAMLGGKIQNGEGMKYTATVVDGVMLGGEIQCGEDATGGCGSYRLTTGLVGSKKK